MAKMATVRFTVNLSIHTSTVTMQTDLNSSLYKNKV